MTVTIKEYYIDIMKLDRNPAFRFEGHITAEQMYKIMEIITSDKSEQQKPGEFP